MTEDSPTAGTVVDDPTPHVANKTILTPPIKINWRATLIDFSERRKDCPHRNGDLCLEDPDCPQDCEIGLCPILEMPISRRAAFSKLEEGKR